MPNNRPVCQLGVLPLYALLALLFVLTGCGATASVHQSTQSTPNSTVAAATPTTVPTATPGPGDALSGWRFAPVGFTDPLPNVASSEPGYVYAGVSFAVTNLVSNQLPNWRCGDFNAVLQATVNNLPVSYVQHADCSQLPPIPPHFTVQTLATFLIPQIAKAFSITVKGTAGDTTKTWRLPQELQRVTYQANVSTGAKVLGDTTTEPGKREVKPTKATVQRCCGGEAIGWILHLTIASQNDYSDSLDGAFVGVFTDRGFAQCGYELSAFGGVICSNYRDSVAPGLVYSRTLHIVIDEVNSTKPPKVWAVLYFPGTKPFDNFSSDGGPWGVYNLGTLPIDAGVFSF